MNDPLEDQGHGRFNGQRTKTIRRHGLKANTCCDNNNLWIAGDYLSAVSGALSWTVLHYPGSTAASGVF